MDKHNHPPLKKESAAYVVEDWPMGLEATRDQLKKAQQRLERYQAALRLAGVEIKRRNRGITALMTFAYQASSTANPATLLKLALIQALETTGASVGATVLINTETKALNLKVHKGLTPKLTQILAGQELGYGATALMPHLVAGAGALLEYQTSTDKLEQALLKSGRLTSLVSLPLQLGPRLVGAFLVGLRDERVFTPAELYFLLALSQEVTLALENLRLREGLWHTAESLLGEKSTNLDLQNEDEFDLNAPVPSPFDLPLNPPKSDQPAENDLEQLLAAMMEAEDEVQQQNADLQTLNVISEMMNRTLNLKEILQYAVDQTKATLKADAAWLYLLNEGGQLDLRAHNGLSKSYVQAMRRLDLTDGVEGLVVTDEKAYFVESIREAGLRHKIWVDKEGIHGMAAVPISRPDLQLEPGQNGSQVIGVLVTSTIKQGLHTWSPRERRLLTSIANQVALVVDNARLHEKLTENEAGLRTGNDILRTINDMLLEKNAFLEGFIQDELIPVLTTTLPLLQEEAAEDNPALTETQKQRRITLQKTMSRLYLLAKEAVDITEALDTESDKLIDKKTKKPELKTSTKPLRLEKASDKPPASKALETADEADVTTKPPLPPPPAGGDQDVPAKAMSFEEAVANGLVPAHILGRENATS